MVGLTITVHVFLIKHLKIGNVLFLKYVVDFYEEYHNLCF